MSERLDAHLVRVGLARSRAQAVEAIRAGAVGYLLKNTVSDHGSVARGVCAAGKNGKLANVTERTRIEKFPDGIRYTEDDRRARRCPVLVRRFLPKT